MAHSTFHHKWLFIDTAKTGKKKMPKEEEEHLVTSATTTSSTVAVKTFVFTNQYKLLAKLVHQARHFQHAISSGTIRCCEDNRFHESITDCVASDKHTI